jgi:hypothetical protein
MMKNSILLSIILGLLIGACKKDDVDLLKMVTELKTDKTSIEQVRAEQLGTDELKTIKKYYAKLNSVIYSLKKSKKLRKKMNRHLEKEGVIDICKSVLLDRETHNGIVLRCKYDSFMICSEEVLHYYDFINLFKKMLTPENHIAILANKDCKAKM